MGQVQDLTVTTAQCRLQVRRHYLADESKVIGELIHKAQLTEDDREAISTSAAALVQSVRTSAKYTIIEKFLAQYGLSTKEGIALMCLAEALLRVPDKITLDDLIEDKVGSGNWALHRGQSNSSLINSSTWALLITGKLIAPVERKGLGETLRGLVKRLGEPVVRGAVAQAMKELGRQFVFGRSITEATKRAQKQQAKGYTYSYDMLGEAAHTDADARRYHAAYSSAIAELAESCHHTDIRLNPGISVKLSALHSRYEFSQQQRLMQELVPRVLELARQAKAANMSFNIDAEEADRLDISLDVIEAVLADPELAGWQGFGVVVQAFGPRASYVLDWLYALAQQLDRNIMVRLVKGAYWDAEIKRAQELGLDGYPVFTRKVNSDLSYIACAKQLLAMTDRIYPQFATHNAHSVAAILHLAQGQDNFEFQRLHGMGESLHEEVANTHQTRCRIYAPVGAHRDLLAYLVRRLLENGANSSFVNQIVDTTITPEQIARDPFAVVMALGEQVASEQIARPAELFGSTRRNAKGWDITDPMVIAEIDAGRDLFKNHLWSGAPILAGETQGADITEIYNPAAPDEQVGTVTDASSADIEQAIHASQAGFQAWSALTAQARGEKVRRVADLFEQHAPELFALATREAGKTLLDAVGEIREAIDFARYYADEAIRNEADGTGRGVMVCISPWNFPLAIFSGQVLAALAAGNAVIAKPAEPTVLLATRAVQLMHQAGIPRAALQLLPGSGASVGTALTSDPRIAGVCFTGSTPTAQRINRVMAENLAPDAPLVAETGGLNAMIVDSSALPEQVVRDVLASAFQSAGQRCSALRMLYVQKDIAEPLLEMLFGAMDELSLGNPWQLSTDIGPVIDRAAQLKIETHCAHHQALGQVLKCIPAPQSGFFIPPTVIKLEGIEELDEEIFGPILHVATFEADQIDQVVDAINAKGYGLTFGLHTRIDSRVERITRRVQAGNLYVNRNQIGAIVGSQPFGGEGLSGTGPKAGGPHYVRRFMRLPQPPSHTASGPVSVTRAQLQQALDQLNPSLWRALADRQTPLKRLLGNDYQPLGSTSAPILMPGPTGETNQFSRVPRGVVLCLGPDREQALAQANMALAQGNGVVAIAPGLQLTDLDAAAAGVPLIIIDGLLQPEALQHCDGFEAITSGADPQTLRNYRIALATREGALLPLLSEWDAPERFVIERHLCVDTTAAGGNASLIASMK
ncbi:MAG: RHH-type proline utilization regulon transcriptional repressor/proline dehydrogenase [Motiliproteus sp.]|jgi:RHH-type proline utilization regulon transcriptional repressor/proline dehydrogenase/delta 1-pyrroline-5-carboxylate dehydrogenase